MPLAASFLLRTSWLALGICAEIQAPSVESSPSPPNPPLAVSRFTDVDAPFVESSFLQATPRWFLECLQRLRCHRRNLYFFEHHGGGCRPPQPPRWVLDIAQRFEAPFVESSPYTSSLARTSWGGLPPPPTPPLAVSMLTEIDAPFVESSILQATPRWFLACLQRLTHPWLNRQFFEHQWKGCRPPRRWYAPFVESSILQSPPAGV